ncbi:CoA-acylating methylmalonate-semialdehyde dehydrogenase [Leptothoe sp. PORK10 BA2]|uniref:CoA-acylating methylmalonate-semialdehyde dehydrogenase n=1 Tax=Leptothoe sp. PORK10 BA2 TaxID=3110254 RepID=UPI002B21B811|nr:CoA-acylating methylmalonate-semialdehyde dehydrogenase [Leptothoe sp. PORK10 BA2]MEA5463191.1 CoA-acylating methylmalonate-semialdehyde dehydrogenase [Leptothoe sp. PORK10 BA2]
MKQLRNYIAGEWHLSKTTDYLDVINPATNDVLAEVPLSLASDLDQAVTMASEAFTAWRRVPPTERIQYLFKLKTLLEEHRDEIAKTITVECGKTLKESEGELQRAIENVEVACGIPILMQGVNSEDIAQGIDEIMIRQPLGVVGIIAPFNFPAMIPFWFFPYAIACGNTCIIKPSEKVPQTMQRITELIHQTGLPAGVVNLVHGSKTVVDALLDHPTVKAISFVGSSPVARYIYSRAAETGKRVQCQGGAKNPVVILPDADLEMTTRIVADSAFGCAGQRCLAASLAITVGSVKADFTDAMVSAAQQRVVGNGLDDGVQMGAVINQGSCDRIQTLIQKGIDEGGNLLVDGRDPQIPGHEQGNFIRPTLLQDIPLQGDVATTEIFGPVLGLLHANTLDDAITLVNQSRWGNMACLFTNSGAAARKFRYEAAAGNIGINIGVAAPMAFFPFSGWKESFYGDLHGQSQHAVEFFTQTKVVVERWPKEWSRQF